MCNQTVGGGGVSFLSIHGVALVLLNSICVLVSAEVVKAVSLLMSGSMLVNKSMTIATLVGEVMGSNLNLKLAEIHKI